MGATVQRTRTPAGDPAWLVSDYETVKRLLADPRLGRTHPDPDRASRYSESVAEQQCCPFFTFRLTLAGDHVELDAHAPDGADALVAGPLGEQDPSC